MMAEKVFVNGFTSWQETHFEVCVKINSIISLDTPFGLVAERHEAQGHGGLYELAEELTDDFELLNKGRVWDGEFFDQIDAWLEEKLK